MNEFMPVFSFDRVNESTDRTAFSRIGLEDRNMIYVMGGMFLVLVIFVTA